MRGYKCGALTQFDPSVWHSRVAYIGYLFDLRVGWATTTSTSHGQRFRVAFADPTLLADVP